MKKIYLDKEQPLTAQIVKKIVEYFRLNMLPDMITARNYFEGNQKIKEKYYDDPTKPCVKIVKNYARSIVLNFQGYIIGNPITYSAKTEDAHIEDILDIFDWNDVASADADLLKTALIYGVAPEIVYLNEEGEKKFKVLSPEEVIPIYNADLDEELIYVIRIRQVSDWTRDGQYNYFIDIYSSGSISHFKTDDSYSQMTLIGEEPVYGGNVPFSIFYSNDGESIFKCIIDLQDAYNSALSDSIEDLEAFTDAYLVLKNMTADSEDISKMKENRVMILDDNSDAFYLTKSASDANAQNILDDLNEAIHNISNSPDFNSDSFNSGVSSGISIKYKLIGFDNIASGIERQMEKAIQNRIYLLSCLLELTDGEEQGNEINIEFNENLPIDINENADLVNKLRGLVSNETLLTQLPFITDVEEEMKKIENENNYNLWGDSFNGNSLLEQESSTGE